MDCGYVCCSGNEASLSARPHVRRHRLPLSVFVVSERVCRRSNARHYLSTPGHSVDVSDKEQRRRGGGKGGSGENLREPPRDMSIQWSHRRRDDVLQFTTCSAARRDLRLFRRFPLFRRCNLSAAWLFLMVSLCTYLLPRPLPLFS